MSGVEESSSSSSSMEGAPLCSHYALNGICKFGHSCKFNHPMSTLSYSPSASSLTDMPVAPYPVGSSMATLAPSSSSSELKPELISGSSNEALSTIMPTNISTAAGSVGSIFSSNTPLLQSSIQQSGQNSTPSTGSSSAPHRVTVYYRNDDGKWDNHGTGHVTVDNLQGFLVVDNEDNKILLEHHISPDDIYRKLSSTLISWTDPQYSIDVCLGFQKNTGCSCIWDQVCSVQRSLQLNTLTDTKASFDRKKEINFMKFNALSSVEIIQLLSQGDSDLQVTEEQMKIILNKKSSFIVGRPGTGKTSVLIMKLYLREKGYSFASEEENESLRQLFVTVNPKLCYAVKQHVSQLISFERGRKFSEDEDGMDDDAEINDIPNSFRDLNDDYYPLFITYQKFLVMLDGTIGESYLEHFCDSREVNYERFHSCYWIHFDKNLTKKLDASRVFTEITSYIKGGLQAVESCDSKLSRDEYLGTAECRDSSLSRQNREKIYDIYVHYEKMKMGRGEYDLADLVIDLHHRLKKERFEGQKMAFVYIDEVQDLTMSQVALFRYICENVDDGFVFSCDTAQTIARGIEFRFQDIRSLFYKFFMESGAVIRKDKGCFSEVFHLGQNFRTHDGVLQLAQSVIDLLYRYFPDVNDIVKPESSLIHGEAPVLLQPGNKEHAIVTIFGNSSRVDKKVVRFGAEQVILVRDDSVRKDIASLVGGKALILTILECKGLEFQDVLLYNFFASSPLKKQWRVVYEYMDEKCLFDATCTPSFPRFNEARHYLLSSELKQLYVAITRAKHRLWISENTMDLPMFEYWTKKCLVQVRKLDDSLAQAMQVASTSEEWRSNGIKLYFENNFEMAKMCFERAGDKTWERRAKASGLKADADRMRESNSKVAASYLREAAEIFDSIGKAESAAGCYRELGEFEIAGRIYLNKCGDHELKKAADCFNLAGCYLKAAEVYSKGNNISECLSVCTKEKLFDNGLKYIEVWKQNNFKDVGAVRNKEIEVIEQNFLESCARSYHEMKDHKSMMKFVGAFYSTDLKRSFLKSVNCLDELLLLEEESGNFVGAALIAELKGDLIRKADLLGKAGEFDRAATSILWYVFCNSVWVNRSKGWPLKQFKQKEELFCKAKEYAKKYSDSLYELVCVEINTLSHEQSQLADLGKYLEDSQKHNTVRGKMLSLRKIVEAQLGMNIIEYEWEGEKDGVVAEPEKIISQNKVSVQSLYHFWNDWITMIEKLLHSIHCLESGKFEDISYTEYAEFCLNYFGTGMQDNNINADYVVYIPDAHWLIKVEKRALRESGSLKVIDRQQFLSSARCYWESVLLSGGLKLLKILEALTELKRKDVPSIFMPYLCHGIMLKVANYLLGCKYLKLTSHDSKALLRFVNLPLKIFKDLSFPLDWRQASEHSLWTRLSDFSQLCLEYAIDRHISNKAELTYGEIGDVVMMWLGTDRSSLSAKWATDMCGRILSRFKANLCWWHFIHTLDIGPLKAEFNVMFTFYQALEDTYNADHKQSNYITPNCFLYLMDRLLILVLHSRGFFITTRFSFMELFLSQRANSAYAPESLTKVDKAMVGTIADFLAETAYNLLLNKSDAFDWISRSKLTVKDYYPIFVLKLMVMMCLMCLQSRTYHHLLLRLLNMSYITRELPVDLLDILQKSRNYYFVGLSAKMLSEVFCKIGDPLVTVCFGGGVNMQQYPASTICVDMATVGDDEKGMVRVLFPGEKNAADSRADINVEENTIHTDTRQVGTSQDLKGNKKRKSKKKKGRQ